jgi:dolichol-phosphate mannosyltransferase
MAGKQQQGECMKNVVFLPTAIASSGLLPAGAQSERNLAVIIPTLNERDNVEPLIRTLDIALAGIPHELVFVDDWSLDGTYQLLVSIARVRPDIRVVGRQGRRGLSSAVIDGVMATSADIVAVIDADMQHDETILGDMFETLIGDRADVAIGSRYGDGGSCGEWDAQRLKMSQMATRIAQSVLPGSVNDPMSGFFMIRRDIVVNMIPDLSQKGFKILLDLLMSSPYPLRVTEIPYTFRSREAGVSKLSASVVFSFLWLVLQKTFRKYVPLRFQKFGMVGLMGAGVHLVILRSLLTTGHMGFAAAQACAVIAAIGFNFALNNMITYSDRRLSGWRLITGALSFYTVCGLGAISNVGMGSLIYSGHHRWWVAGVAGAIVGSVWNFAMSSTLTWRR